MSLLAVDSYINARQDSDEATTALNNIVAAINNADFSLLNLVEHLGPLLTNSDPFARAKGVGLLSSVLVQCSPDRIGKNSATVLLNFYLERLQDQPSVGELLKGLHALLKADVLTEHDAKQISPRIFAELAVQTYQQTVRYLVFSIFDILMQRHLKGVKALGSDFVSGFIQAMDGEKDPRNLLLAFRTIKLLIEHLDYTQFAEDLFGVVFCYFPITFRPPPDDVYGITADDLKVALRDCISATPLFAKYAMPLLMEKLASVSGSAKRDSMETLTVCAPVYGPEALAPHSEHLWTYLKEEVFKAADDANITAALAAVRAVSVTLSSATVTSSTAKSPLESFLQLAVKDSLHTLEDPELKYAKLSGRMLVAAAAASDPACHFMVNAIFPTVVEQCRVKNLPTRQKTLVDILIDFVKASRDVYGSVSVTAMEVDHDFVSPILLFKDDLVGIFSAASFASTEYMPLRRSGIKGLAELLISRQLLDATELGMAVQELNRALLTDRAPEVRSEALSYLAKFAMYLPDLVLQATLPEIFGKLPVGRMDNAITQTEVDDLVKAVEELSNSGALRTHALQRLLELLDSVSELREFTESDVKYAESVGASIYAILERGLTEQQDDTANSDEITESIFQPLLTKAVTAAMTGGMLITHESVIQICARILACITRFRDSSGQQNLLNQAVDIFVHGNLNHIPSVPMSTAFSPLSSQSPPDQANVCLLFSAIVCNCRPEVTLPVPNVSEFLDSLVERASESSHVIFTESLAKITASIINKLPDDNQISLFLADLMGPKLRLRIFDQSAPIRERSNRLTVYTWVAKAIILRSHPKGYDIVSDILSLLDSEDLGREAAACIGTIVQDPADGTLTRQSYAKSKLLYKQRFFGHCVPHLISGFQIKSAGIKQFYLIALSHLLKSVPKQVLSNVLPQLFPLLLFSLSVPNPDLKLATLDTLQAMMNDARSSISSHISSIITALLQMGTARGPENGNTMHVRIAALKVLGDLPDSVEYSVLHPLKPTILRQLNGALDDPKRLVRKEAANTRNKWFLLLGPRES